MIHAKLKITMLAVGVALGAGIAYSTKIREATPLLLAKAVPDTQMYLCTYDSGYSITVGGYPKRGDLWGCVSGKSMDDIDAKIAADMQRLRKLAN